MTDKKQHTPKELRGIGHDYLRWAREQAIGGEVTVQGLAAIGILATLLWIGDDVAVAVNIYDIMTGGE